jgi:hypothetical protein
MDLLWYEGVVICVYGASNYCSVDINLSTDNTNTYDHRTLKTRLPVRSALFKQRTGGLVVRWVTTSEYPLLYVFCCPVCLEREVWAVALFLLA